MLIRGILFAGAMGAAVWGLHTWLIGVTTIDTIRVGVAVAEGAAIYFGLDFLWKLLRSRN